MDKADIIMTCPYNKAHSIISSRMQFHLTKCRVQYPNAEKSLCPYNSTHIINKLEMEYHKQICGDRITMDTFLCKIGTTEAPETRAAKVEPIEISGDEIWDDTASESVLDKVHEASKNKATLQALIGAPKSERKAFRNQERLRMQRVLDNQLQQQQLQEAENKKTGSLNLENECSLNARGEYSNRRDRYEIEGGSNNSSHHQIGSGDQIKENNLKKNGCINQKNSSVNIPRNPRNPWGTNPISPANTSPQEELACTKSFDNMKIETALPKERDPGNPWRLAREQTKNSPSIARADDYPTLPIAGRGRGKKRIASDRTK